MPIRDRPPAVQSMANWKNAAVASHRREIRSKVVPCKASPLTSLLTNPLTNLMTGLLTGLLTGPLTNPPTNLVTGLLTGPLTR